MRFLILDTDYPDFLNWLYAQHPGLEEKPYEEQMQVRRESLFSQVSFCSSNLNKLGHEANEIYVNNEYTQKAWAKEHGLKVDPNRQWQFRLRRGIVPWVSRTQQQRWFNQILAGQIRHYKPDVLLNLPMVQVSSRFHHGDPIEPILLPYLQPTADHDHRDDHCCRAHASTSCRARSGSSPDWTVYDLVVSSFPPTLQWFRSREIPAEMNRHSFEPHVLSCLKDGGRNIPASFVGSFYYSVHDTRIQWLEHICSMSQVQVWSSHTNHLPGSSPILRSHVGSAWGIEMYQVLRDSLLTLNHHGDVGPYANNLRLFEATGVGTLLITDWKENLAEMFEPGKEVIVYRTPEECAELIKYYLEHDDERQAIARAGQQRTLREHTSYQRMQDLVDIVRKYL